MTQAAASEVLGRACADQTGRYCWRFTPCAALGSELCPAGPWSPHLQSGVVTPAQPPPPSVCPEHPAGTRGQLSEDSCGWCTGWRSLEPRPGPEHLGPTLFGLALAVWGRTSRVSFGKTETTVVLVSLTGLSRDPNDLTYSPAPGAEKHSAKANCYHGDDPASINNARCSVALLKTHINGNV